MFTPVPRTFLLAVVLSIILIGVLLSAGGAARAEFSGAPDEPAYFVTSLMLRDYIGLWPHPAPVDWAIQYYIHYPKVAIGHWPPGHFLLQSLWWIPFPPSRESAIWFNAATALAAVAWFYAWARRIGPAWWLPAGCALLLLAPLTQQAMGQTMADLTTLLTGIAVLWTLTRLLEDASSRRLLALGAALAAAILIKPSAVALVPGCLLALALDGTWRRLRLSPLLLAAAATAGVLAVAVGLWQAGTITTFLRRWAGMNMSNPWYIAQLILVAGPGILAAALGGAALGFTRRQPAVLAAASCLAGIAATSYIVRAMREPRHWIAALPMLLLLAMATLMWLPVRWRWAAALGAIVLFPFELYRQTPLGFAELAAQLPRPARMLVSSPNGWSEGCWIATVAAAEHRPGSKILRATKTLVRTDWNSRSYEMMATTATEIEQILDANRVDAVVLHNANSANPMPHHRLLAATLDGSPIWRLCAQAGETAAYCRVKPPQQPPVPIRVDLRQGLGRVIEEENPPR